ncbi:hypothetical protein [Kocuria sp. CPCC 205263]|uniref:hypothetical protein n=1 Tax=Kocuria sp. CPCC 205263 TaxID=3073555 RepID=UPI0034D79052
MSKLGAKSRETRVSLMTGVLVALLILVAGSVVALGQKSEYTAESVIVVLPNADLETSLSAAYYETLSRGQIVATFAEVADNLRFEQQAEERLQLDEGQRDAVTTTVSVVPSTSVILVRATAEEAEVAEQMADGTASLATEYLGNLSDPYRTEIVQEADFSAYVSSTSPALLFGLTLIVALIAGVAVQQAIYHLLGALGRRRQSAADGTTASEAAEGKFVQYEGSWR